MTNDEGRMTKISAEPKRRRAALAAAFLRRLQPAGFTALIRFF